MTLCVSISHITPLSAFLTLLFSLLWLLVLVTLEHLFLFSFWLKGLFYYETLSNLQKSCKSSTEKQGNKIMQINLRFPDKISIDCHIFPEVMSLALCNCSGSFWNLLSSLFLSPCYLSLGPQSWLNLLCNIQYMDHINFLTYSRLWNLNSEIFLVLIFCIKICWFIYLFLPGYWWNAWYQSLFSFF